MRLQAREAEVLAVDSKVGAPQRGAVEGEVTKEAERPPSSLIASPEMAAGSILAREKLDQAVEILNEQDVDLWLTFVRETLLTSDPCLDVIAGTYCAWQGAFLVSSTGERIAIVGRFDAPSVRELNAYDDVIGYDESIRPALVSAIERLAPRSIALNYSESDPAADGLTHGLWLVLNEALAGTDYADRLVSSESIVNALRGRKSPGRSSESRLRCTRPRRSSPP